MNERWTWEDSAGPGITSAFTVPDWCGRLESASPDSVVGKVLCVCAAMAIAREVVVGSPVNLLATESLDLLSRWIDDPTVDRFNRICGIIFDPDSPDEIGPYGVAWWALRTATSSVGNGEAGWALATTCSAAVHSGFSRDQIRRLAELAVLARQGSMQ